MTRQPHTLGLTSIVAVGLDGAIGVNNGLPWRLKSDLRFFKQTTLDNVVIMGRKTFESIGGCLKKRENIVLSHRASLFPNHAGCHQAHGIGETLYLREKYKKKSAYIIGGGLTYAAFAPFVDRYLVTIVNSRFPHADAHFDHLIFGSPDDWNQKEIEVEKIDDAGADEFEFTVVELTHKDPAHIAELRSQQVSDYMDRNHFLKRKAMFSKASAGKKLDPITSLA